MRSVQRGTRTKCHTAVKASRINPALTKTFFLIDTFSPAKSRLVACRELGRGRAMYTHATAADCPTAGKRPRRSATLLLETASEQSIQAYLQCVFRTRVVLVAAGQTKSVTSIARAGRSKSAPNLIRCFVRDNHCR